MSVLIVGSKGNMGRRYTAILKYLGVQTRGIDVDTPDSVVEREINYATRAIIASPTETHCAWLKTIAPYNVPILCEKPLAKDLVQVKKALEHVEACGTRINMVYQYRELANPKSRGNSHYNYWNHGRDGLIWDCIQVIGLARGPVSLTEDSPIWDCKINGRTLDIGDMDRAYITHVESWLKNPGQSINEIMEIHQKTAELAKKWPTS
jgi:hypothetical protein